MKRRHYFRPSNLPGYKIKWMTTNLNGSTLPSYTVDHKNVHHILPIISVYQWLRLTFPLHLYQPLGRDAPHPPHASTPIHSKSQQRRSELWLASILSANVSWLVLHIETSGVLCMTINRGNRQISRDKANKIEHNSHRVDPLPKTRPPSIYPKVLRPDSIP